MLVKLKRQAFIGGTRYRPDRLGTVIPDRFRSILPSDAEVLSDPELDLEELAAEAEVEDDEEKEAPAKTLSALAHQAAKEQALPVAAPRAKKAE